MTNYNKIISVDPGVKGGITILEKNVSPKVYRIPVKSVVVNKKTKNIYDIDGIVSLLKHCVNAVFVQEQVGVRPGEGGVSAYGFGKSAGLTLGIAAGLGFEICEVHPRTWKKHFPELTANRIIDGIKRKKKKITEERKKLSVKNIKDKDQKKENNKQIKELKKQIEKLDRQIKAESKTAARRLVASRYPYLADEVRLVRDDGKAESLLIALWYKESR